MSTNQQLSDNSEFWSCISTVKNLTGQKKAIIDQLKRVNIALKQQNEKLQRLLSMHDLAGIELGDGTRVRFSETKRRHKPTKEEQINMFHQIIDNDDIKIDDEAIEQILEMIRGNHVVSRKVSLSMPRDKR